MRKSLKRKLRSCAMCKPHKMSGANRWDRRAFVALRRDEREIKEAYKEK